MASGIEMDGDKMIGLWVWMKLCQRCKREGHPMDGGCDLGGIRMK